MLAACTVLSLQCLLIIYWARRYARPDGRAHVLLIIGASISLVGLMLRVVAILRGAVAEMPYNVSNLTQTISVSIGTVTVITLSLGWVLLSKERSESALQHLALRDALTGIANRRAILTQLASELERARRAGTPLAFAMIDVDHFKQINDVHGHLAGDEVLRHFVHSMEQRLRQSDSLGRYGGEEFLLLLPDTHADGALNLVGNLREFVAHSPAPFGDDGIPHTFSAGLWCGVPGPQDTVPSLIAQADAALYKAKSSGRNTVRLAETGPGPDGQRRG
jgi:diguanylate cyclase (GGDEF)-like protein